jgi:adenosylmethionine-8-amino-7-oxononanoate aminotransferase
MDKITWLRKDLRHSWHPYTQMSTLATEPPMLIDRAEGLFLFDAEGNRYYDAISSWWCNVHGHGHSRIREAVARQMERLDHVLFAGVTHEPAVRLASRLAAIAPEGLSRVFFSDNGSTAVEVALKMSLQCWRNLGREERTGFVCLDHGYHGDTTGCMSVSGVEPFLRAFRPILFPARRVPAPYCYRCPVGKTYPECEISCVDALGDALREGGEAIAAVILEPLLLGAAGMIVYPPGYLSRAAALARERGVHLILDEVATGFGRTGTMFACEQEDVVPDFLCLAKGLSGGYMPLAATLASERVYEGFLGEHDELKTFFHGHTYTGNPLACAAALATLDVFEEEHTIEILQDRIALLGQLLADLVEPLPRVREMRRVGFMCGIELEAYEPSLRMGHQVTLEARRRGVIVRPLGDVVVLMPPLSIEPEVLEELVEVVADSIAAATGSSAVEALAA